MEIRKETTITPLTTDGKALVAGETVEQLSYRDIVQKLFVKSLFTV